MGFIADSSVVLSWLLEDEESPAADKLLDSFGNGAVAEAPVLLRYEVVNGLLAAFARRKRISREAYVSALRDFDMVPMRYDNDSPRLAVSRVAGIAEKHGLSIYDAAYLELAERKRLPLATLDARLATAASSCSLSLAL